MIGAPRSARLPAVFRTFSVRLGCLAVSTACCIATLRLSAHESQRKHEARMRLREQVRASRATNAHGCCAAQLLTIAPRLFVAQRRAKKNLERVENVLH